MQPAYGPMPPPLPVLSHDAAWWWNGERWLPTISADGAYRFDGTRWQRVRRLPRWLAISGLIWLLILASWLLAGTVFLAVGPVNGSIAELAVVGGLGVVAVIATIAWGAFVAWRGETRWLWPAAVAGTAVQLFFYVTAMLAAPQSPGSADNDTAAGAGVVLLAIPTAVIILTLLWLGAALGALIRIVRARLR
jgi:hypothetical protein